MGNAYLLKQASESVVDIFSLLLLLFIIIIIVLCICLPIKTMANLPHGPCVSTITDYCYFYFYHFIFVTKISRVTANVVDTGSGTNGETILLQSANPSQKPFGYPSGMVYAG